MTEEEQQQPQELGEGPISFPDAKERMEALGMGFVADRFIAELAQSRSYLQELKETESTLVDQLKQVQRARAETEGAIKHVDGMFLDLVRTTEQKVKEAARASDQASSEATQPGNPDAPGATEPPATPPLGSHTHAPPSEDLRAEANEADATTPPEPPPPPVEELIADVDAVVLEPA